MALNITGEKSQAELQTWFDGSTLTAAEKNSYDIAATDAHEHDNKTILDATTEAFTTANKDKLSVAATLAPDGKLEASQIPTSLQSGLRYNGDVDIDSESTLDMTQCDTGCFFKMVSPSSATGVTITVSYLDVDGSTTLTRDLVVNDDDWVVLSEGGPEDWDIAENPATTETSGIVRLSGDLGGTANEPIVNTVQGGLDPLSMDNMVEGANTRIMNALQDNSLGNMLSAGVQNISTGQVNNITNMGSLSISGEDWAKVSTLDDVTDDNWALLGGSDPLAVTDQICDTQIMYPYSYYSTSNPTGARFNVSGMYGASGSTCDFDHCFMTKINKGDGTCATIISGECIYYGIDQAVTLRFPIGTLTEGNGTVTMTKAFNSIETMTYNIKLTASNNQITFDRNDSISGNTPFQFIIMGTGTWNKG